MNKLPWFKFYPDDWITGTREMSTEEKAAWIDLLCFMWKADQRGSVSGSWEGIARMIGVPWLNCESIIRSMERKNYINLTESNQIITITSRRMQREENHRESNRLKQREFYKRKPNQNLTDKSQKSEVIKDRDKDNVLVVSPPKDGDDPTPEDLISLWNITAHASLPRVELLNESRKRKAKSRLSEHPEKGFWESLIQKINRSPLLTGQKVDWRCSFDWILEPSNLVKIVEGNYDPEKRR